MLRGLTQTADSYDEAVACLHERYNRPRVIHHEHVRNILQAPSMKGSYGKELRKLYDTCKQHIRAIQLAGQFDLETFLTSVMELKLDERTRLKWMEYSNDHMKTPPYTELLKFLDVQAQHFESAMSERKSQWAAPKSFAITSGRDEVCVACRKESHPLATCTKFQGLSQEERWDVVRKSALCKNCLKSGHIATNCFKPPLCRKCSRCHHTLLHFETDSTTKGTKKEGTEEVRKEKCHLAPAPKTCEQVLLMTCKLKVHAPDGSNTIARGLIDTGSSTSYISERLVQRLRLRRRKKSTVVEGVTGSTVARTRGSVDFYISNAGDTSDSPEFFYVRGHVLSKICNDLPQHPILPDLHWDHLSDLELADPEFKTPSCIDVLLGSEVFQQILGEGRRNGPPGTPSAIETMLGWVVFGKVKGGDVGDIDDEDVLGSDDSTSSDDVEVTNQIFQRNYEHYMKAIEAYPSVFLSVVRTDKGKNVRHKRRRKRRTVQEQPYVRRGHGDQRTHCQGFDSSRISQDVSKRSLHSKTLEKPWVSAGGMLAPKCEMLGHAQCN